MLVLRRRLNLDSVTATDFIVFFDMSMFYMTLLCLELDATFFHILLLIHSVRAVGTILCLLISQNPVLQLVTFSSLLSCS